MNKLELTWVGKENRAKLEPRILIEEVDKSYHAENRYSNNDEFDNKLIFGDNLLALKALENDYYCKVKCVYIDPPYNTKSAFAQYDDNLEHSIWLGLMRDRLEILKNLLRKDGIIFIHIDDNEQAYLKVLLDEIFGRKNFCGQFVWEKKKKPSFLNANMGIVTEYILAYSPDRSMSPPFIGGVTTEGKKYPINNAGNGLQELSFSSGSVRFKCADGVYQPQDMSEGKIKTELLDQLVVVNGRNKDPFRLKGEWRYSQKKLDEIIMNQEPIVISKIPFRPNHIKEGGEDKKIKNLLSIAHYNIPTYEDSNEESIKLFGNDNAFDYPKPEGLLEKLIESVTNPGDLVLDSFAGSGTTGAVAHKMGRRWIMIELGEHCHTHIIPRLKKVIDGEDKGGITEAVGWKGGGGFRYYRLAPSLLQKDKWDNWVINKEYKPEMLAEAVCKLEGFDYDPSDSIYWMHGHSTEHDYIYVTTQTLAREQLQLISDEVGDDRTLLVMCSAFKGNADDYKNLTVKKIPNSILSKCEWAHDDYSLQIENLPMAEKPKKNQGDLFDEDDEQ